MRQKIFAVKGNLLLKNWHAVTKFPTIRVGWGLNPFTPMCMYVLEGNTRPPTLSSEG